ISSTGPGAWNHPSGNVQRVGTHIQRGSCAAPDLPGSFRIPQSFQKPRFLLGSEDGLRGVCLTQVRNLLVPETDGVGRFASVVTPAAIDDFKHLLGHELRIIFVKEICVSELGSGILGSVASLVGDHELDVPAPAERTVSLQTMDRRKIVSLLPESMLVENRDRRILNLRWAENFERGTTALQHTRGLILKKYLHGGNLARLRRTRFAVEHLQGLPSLPAVLMVIPHGNKGKAGTSVLQVGIVQVAAIHSAVVIHVDRDVEVLNFLSLRITNDFLDLAVVISGAVLRIPDHLVDEVTQVQNEAEAVLLRSFLILEDHSSVRVHRSEICVLATDEREMYRPEIIIGRRGNGAADAAAGTLRISKAIPIDLRRLQSADQHTTGPIRLRRNRHSLRCDHTLERLVERHFDDQFLGRFRLRSSPGPQQHAVAVRIARGYTFREKVAPLAPGNLRGSRE